MGKRFYDETGGQFAANDYKSLDPYVPASYLNAKNVKYNPNNFINAALAGIGDAHNGGGPIWAIFDADAVAREDWTPKPPNVDIDAGFFFSADTLADLAKKIVMKYQRVPMPPENLEATVARYNSFVDAGKDEDFGKPKPLHKIAKPPFHAAWATPVVHDTRAGLRIDANCQVVDMNGQVIPGLYCGGELHRDITRIRKTPVRANRTIEVLRGAFNLAIRWHWRQDNPAKGIQRNPEEKRERYLNKTDIMALARALNEQKEVASANAIKLLMLTGARRGEVLNATWDMFDLDQGIWVKPSAHTKQRRIHRVPLSGPAIELLRSIRTEATSQFVFCGAGGKALIDIKRTWSSACKVAGLTTQVPKRTRSGKVVVDSSGAPIMIDQPNVRMHDLRHSFASILVSAGASLPLIGQLLGHTQAQTTHRYAHLFDRPMRDAAEAVGAFVEVPRIVQSNVPVTKDDRPGRRS
ncbi:MAG: tyrosine-type recombinase/integrase [Bradyrhizobium sp.]